MRLREPRFFFYLIPFSTLSPYIPHLFPSPTPSTSFIMCFLSMYPSIRTSLYLPYLSFTIPSSTSFIMCFLFIYPSIRTSLYLPYLSFTLPRPASFIVCFLSMCPSIRTSLSPPYLSFTLPQLHNINLAFLIRGRTINEPVKLMNGLLMTHRVVSRGALVRGRAGIRGGTHSNDVGTGDYTGAVGAVKQIVGYEL